MLQTIEIFQESDTRKKEKYRAIHGMQQAEGKTPGKALDSLERLLADKEGETGSLIILQRFQPDAFFSKPQQERLKVLMNQFHEGINAEVALSQEDRAELEQLIDVEWMAAIARAATILTKLDSPKEQQ